MDQTGLIYVLGFGFAATTFVFGTILFSWLITHRRARPQKGLPYESGIDTIGDTWSRFGLAFYLYALLFVAFDVEIIFVYLWAISVRAIEVQGMVVIGVFLAILLVRRALRLAEGRPAMALTTPNSSDPTAAGDAASVTDHHSRTREPTTSCCASSAWRSIRAAASTACWR